MKKIFLLMCCLLFILCIDNSSANEYSLNDLYKLALERSETIKIAEEDLNISELDKDRALSVLFPTLSAFGTHTHYSDDKTQGTFLLQPEYTNEWGVRLDQSLSLSGKEFTALRIAKEGIKIGRFDLVSVKEDFLMEVISRYFIVLGTNESLEIAGQNVERLKKHRDAAKTRLEVGEATKTVLLRAKAELAGAQSDLIKAENNLSIAKARLAQSVHISGDYALKEPESGSIGINSLTADCKLPDIPCLSGIAILNRSEIQAEIKRKDIALDKVKVARGSYWPDLSIEGVYVREENEPSSTFGLDERIYGALKLNFPFFEGGLRKAEVSQEKARLRQAEYRLEDLKRSIEVDVENSYLVVKREDAVLTQTRAEVEYGRDNYNSVTKQFKYGLADSIDVMDANTLLVTAERELASAKFLYQLSVLRLQRSIGSLLKTVTEKQSTVVDEQ